jgi:hypothetical protein
MDGWMDRDKKRKKDRETRNRCKSKLRLSTTDLRPGTFPSLLCSTLRIYIK